MKLTTVLLLGLLLIGCGTPTTTDDHSGHDHSTMDHSSMDHSTVEHSSMNHSNIESSPGAADAPLELQFLDTMIVHHEGAIEMAKLGTTRAGRPEARKFMDAVIEDQDRQITQMKRWRGEWYKDANPAINAEFPGIHEGMEGMDTYKLYSINGNDFDAEFVRQMIRHHEGAVIMSNRLLKATGEDAPRKELKQLAGAIVRSQSAEIEHMKKWLTEWN